MNSLGIVLSFEGIVEGKIGIRLYLSEGFLVF